jgi:RND family efflux transporter MFP subunit
VSRVAEGRSKPEEASTLAARRPALLGVLLLLALTACEGDAPVAAPEPRPVRVVTVEKRESGETATLTGTVQAQVEADLSFRIGGRITDRYVNLGDTVQAGQVVARLDRADEENNWRAARAQLVAAQGRLVEMRNDYARQRDLLAAGFAPRARYDQAVQALSAAQSAVDQAEAQLSLATDRLGHADLVADAPGVVTARGAEVGEVVQSGRMIVRVARPDGRDALFDVPASLRDAAPADPVVDVWLTMNPEMRAKGRVREVSPQADPVTGTFAIRVGLSEVPSAMRLGSTVTGRIGLAGTAGIRLPASALTRAEREPAVWVVEPATGAVALRRVEVARFDPAHVHLAGGVAPGELVVTAGVQALKPGQKVRVLGAPR